MKWTKLQVVSKWVFRILNSRPFNSIKKTGFKSCDFDLHRMQAITYSFVLFPWFLNPGS